MKKLISFTVMALSIAIVHAQYDSRNLPLITNVIPFKLEVGYNFNTAIAFPGTIKKAYWGYKDIMAMEVPEVKNILLVKAAKKNFDPTNLQVFTLDGKIYVFNITYSDSPSRTTFDLRKANEEIMESSTSPISFSDQPLNDLQLEELMKKVRNSRKFISKAATRSDMTLRLKGIYFNNNLLFFSFQLFNRSNLDYDVDFMHLYIKDEHKSRRSSFQQRELIPVKRDTVNTISGQRQESFVIVVPKFTIPDKKEFYFEVYEANGGRTITLRIKNRQLLKAKPV